MTAPGWRVHRTDADRARRALAEGGWIRDDVDVLHAEEWVVFPLVAPAAVPAAVPGERVEAEFGVPRAPAPRNYRDLLALPADAAALLPRSYDVVGDVVVVRLPEELLGQGAAIGAALLQFVPGARVVAHDGGVHGTARRRTLVRLAGAGDFRTLHRENGLTLEVDLAAAYFSPRLAHEHQRVADAVPAGARVLDLCCGIGPFSLTIARAGRAAEVRAVDSNPAAIALLQANLVRLRPSVPVRPMLADLADVLPSAGVADAVILNLPREGIKYLTSVGNAVARPGVLHYYEVTERSVAGDRSRALVELLGGPSEWRVVESHVVHPYSPRADLVAYTLGRERY
jgi:tRNA (guanine37-N1)-methyltransferase